jgi:hypothetical protein
MTSKLIFAIALTTLVAAPAQAQTRYQHGPYPQAQYPWSGPPLVISAGHILGTDPDVHIRSELMRDAPTYYGDN